MRSLSSHALNIIKVEYSMLIGLAVAMILIACAGALVGGQSFGDSLRKGCGCSIWVLIAIFLFILLFLSILTF